MRYLLALLLMTSSASAHDWFTDKVEPGSNLRCCGGSDCADIPPWLFNGLAIVETQKGFIVNLSVKQAQHFNKSTSKPVHDEIPWSRIGPSETGGYAMCIFQDKVRCFFSPRNS